MSTHSDKTRAQLEDLLERGEISREAFAEYSAAADIARPQSAMYDHVTLRIGDLAAGTALFATALEQLEIEQTATTPSFSVWDNFALTETDAEHPIARRVHVAFIAPSRGHVDRFWQEGVAAGFADDGAAGPRRVYADDYYAAFLRDPGGNSFEAIYRDGDRPRGSIDHVALRVADVAASTAFYSTIGNAAGLTLQRQSPDNAAFAAARRTARSSSSPGLQRRASTSRSRAATTTSSASTPTQPRRGIAATASRVRAHATAPATCSTPTATTSKSSTTTASQRRP